MARNPIRQLKSLYPWPEEKPDKPEQHEQWFNPRKQILLREVVPREAKLVVELGSWLGDSTRWFCDWCPDATVVAVDTWLGSTEHLLKRRDLLPVLYDTFLANCWEYRDRLIPFRNTSLSALNFLAGLKLKPDVIYIDSGHDFWGVLSELETSYGLFPKAIMIGDDYTPSNNVGLALKGFVGCGGRVGGSVYRSWEIETQHYVWTVRKK